jgi:hypothetical protein
VGPRASEVMSAFAGCGHAVAMLTAGTCQEET